VVETLETAPPDATHWSTRGLAARHGISHQSVAEIWKAFGLKPWDNLSTHKTPKVHRWLLRHRRFHLHFTPTYSSWLNLVERWFSALTTKKLRRSAHTSVKELAADTTAWVDHRDQNPTPFIWHRSADEILAKLATYCATITGNEYRSGST
jgi:transposase